MSLLADSRSSKTYVLPYHKAIIPDKMQNENVFMSVKTWKDDFTVSEIQWQNLIFVEKLGEGLFGEVSEVIFFSNFCL